MKKIFLFLLTSSFYAQTEKPKIIFRSGFEPNAIISPQGATDSFIYMTGQDNSYLSPNNWTTHLANSFNIQYGDLNNSGNINQRVAEIVNDPTNQLNKVLHFSLYEPNNIANGRIQANLGIAPVSTLCHSIRLYIPSTFHPLDDINYNMTNDWLTIAEYWNNPNWIPNVTHPFRIGLNLVKRAGKKLHIKANAQSYKTTPPTGFLHVWSHLNENFDVPFDKWMTLRILFVEGNSSNGRFKVVVTPDGENPIVLYDITNFTHAPGSTSPDGLSVIHPFKLYTSPQLINDVNLAGGTTNVYWDDFILCDKDGLDLQIRDSEEDSGSEPNNNTPHLWESNDLWIRNQDDKIVQHQNPEYSPNVPNYVNVRINNKSCKPSSGNDIVKLYWAKANISLAWPAPWNGTSAINGVNLGDLIGQITIPVIPAGKDVILSLPWSVPNPQNYAGITTEPWHFCLLARIESNEDTMTILETGSILENAKNNNNIASKNISIVDIISDTPTLITSTVAVGNPFKDLKSYFLDFSSDSLETGNPIYEDAEVSIILDDVIYKAWEDGGKKKSNLKNTLSKNKFIVTSNHALLEDIQLARKNWSCKCIIQFFSKKNKHKI